MAPNPLKTFVIYSSKDKTLREELEGHLRPLVDLGWLDLWSDREIMPGAYWDAAIREQLLAAELFLILVSVDFYNSDYIRGEEFSTAVDRLNNGDALIIPIIVRPCTWNLFPVIKDLQVLPPGGAAVTDLEYWKQRDKAWDAVVQKIADRVQKLLKERQASVPPARPPGNVAAGPTGAQALPPVLQNGQVHRDRPETPEMVYVEGGLLNMGSPDYPATKPLRNVRLSPFWIGKFPVTMELFDLFCAEKGLVPPGDQGWGRGRRPAIRVNWHEAQAYCQWLSQITGNTYRLPSEAEWEFAARGGTISQNYRFAGSDNLDKAGWHSGNSGGKTHPVGEKAGNELGLYDMSGNVWEWCADHWHDDYKNAPADNNAWAKEGNHKMRVLRGGSWNVIDFYCRSVYRYRGLPDHRYDAYGFRIVREI